MVMHIRIFQIEMVIEVYSKDLNGTIDRVLLRCERMSVVCFIRSFSRRNITREDRLQILK